MLNPASVKCTTTAKECRGTTASRFGGSAKLPTRVTRKVSAGSPPFTTTAKECRRTTRRPSAGIAIAADQGDAKGQYYLGSMYYFGKGVAQDFAEAVRWLRKAADQGDAKAQTGLAYMYDHG